MIVFKEKTYSESEQMRLLYTELQRVGLIRYGMYEIINPSQLIPILKGNNVVIEKFVLSRSFFGRDKYRMYLKIGAKAKLPDEVRLPGKYEVERLGKVSFKIKNNFGGGPVNNDFGQKEFGDNKNGQKQGQGQQNNNGGGGGANISTDYGYQADIQMEVYKILGEAIKYDKKSRELILEFDSVYDAIRALNILPFGIRYKIYLLEA